MFNLVTNYSAMYNNLKFANSVDSMRTIRERLSSGLQINRGADGPSDFAISEGLKAHYRGIDVAMQNIQELYDYCEGRDRLMVEQLEIAHRVRDLAVRSANEATLTSADRTRLNDEVAGLVSELDRIGKTSNTRSNDGSQIPQRYLFGPGMIDIVWVMDDTGSMGQHLNDLATGATRMFSELEARKFNLRMGAFTYSNANANARKEDYTTDPNDPSAQRLTTGAPSDALNTQYFSETSCNHYGADPLAEMVFEDNAGAFAGHVNTLSDDDWMAYEAGMQGVYDAAQNLSTAATDDTANNTQFRPGATKIFMIITDEASHDNGYQYPNPGVPPPANLSMNTDNRDVPYYLKYELRDELNTRFSDEVQVWTIGNTQSGGGALTSPDPDYVDVADITGGQAIDLDVNPTSAGGTMQWVTKAVQAMGEIGGRYDLDLQLGPDNGDVKNLEFETVTADTSGINQVDISSVSSAQDGIDQADATIEFIATERANTGHIMNRLQHMLDDYESEYINNRATQSGIADTDFAQYGTKMAKQQVLMNATQAIAVQANAMPTSVLNLISAHGF